MQVLKGGNSFNFDGNIKNLVQKILQNFEKLHSQAVKDQKMYLYLNFRSPKK